MLLHHEKSQPLNKQKEELCSSLLGQTLLKGHWLPGILNKTPNLSARILKTTIFVCVVKQHNSLGQFSFFLLRSILPPISSWTVKKMN